MPRSRAPLGRRILLSTALVGAATLAPVSAAPAASPTAANRQQQYAAAAAEYGVPESVLLAVSYLESRWDTNAGTPSTSAGYGPMHLTDATYVKSLGEPGHYGPAEDPRGDDSRAPVHAAEPSASPAAEAALQTLDAAAAVTGSRAEALRSDPAANIRGGAALLASYQKKIGAPLGAGTDPAAWYGAVARYSGSDSTDSAASFADEVYATIRTGAARTTDDGQRVTLAPRDVTPQKSWLDKLGLRKAARAGGVECPQELACEWIPAPYEQYGPGMFDYGNHDLSDRPARQKIEYIVIHDTEETYARTLELVQDPTYVSWHYTMRSSDGHTAQHVRTKDVAWQAGNWYINAKSIGIEHEGFARQGTWYTESLYRNSAKLVGYLAKRFDIPLDRQHIIGHDNVPGTVPSTVKGMHWDPGPYWDWSHYFDLLKAPFQSTGTARTGLVTIDPDFAGNRPAFWGCTLDDNGSPTSEPCPLRGSSSVILHSAPSQDAPLVKDAGLHADGSPSTMEVSDHGARASAGQTYAIADRQGDWTAIWYLGQKAWFFNPAAAPVAKWATGFVVTPKSGRATIPVYGRAYPEAAAYPDGVEYQTIAPLQYTLSAGQRYAVGLVAPSEYYKAWTVDGSSPGDWTVIRGRTTYVQIQFGHRIMFVNKDDVDIRPSAVGAPR
ncbi:N-acetylmuramoyl-L-alanine amidase [Micromonospora sp. NPDC005806]|uniref:N-acetylmuramoyl-L-alanine amidase n=1 Tax=Micromonospora sp. NPDC005806 TaxID=3364234 RepID=UPI0036C7347C